MGMPSVGPTPRYAFFVYDYSEGDSDKYAVNWRGSEWGVDCQADLRFWYHDPLSQSGYSYLLKHYGLPENDDRFTFEKVKTMSPQDLVAARRKLEREEALEVKRFQEGRDF